MEVAQSVLGKVKWLFDYDNKGEEERGDISDVSDDEHESKEEKDGQNSTAGSTSSKNSSGILKSDSESVVLPSHRNSNSSKKSSKRLSFSTKRLSIGSNKHVSWLTMHRNKMKEWEQRRKDLLNKTTSDDSEETPARSSMFKIEPKRRSWRASFGRAKLVANKLKPGLHNPKSKEESTPTNTARSFAVSTNLTSIAEEAEEPTVGQAKLEDSNIAGIGSDEDMALRKAAAKTEKEFKGIGKKPGLFIWRVENKRTKNDCPDFGIKKWPKSDYGSFFSGDSYIVLNAYKPRDPITGKLRDSLAFDIHFWLGSASTQDEIGVAAYKTVELDALLDDRGIQHRETQYHESRLFQSYFQELVYMKGGVASGFRHVTPVDYEPRLLMIRQQGRSVKVVEIPCESSYMNHGDTFILDTGRVVYRWVGEGSNFFERNRSGLVWHNIVSSRNGKAVKAEPDEKFWEVLGPEENIRSEEDPFIIDEVNQSQTRLDSSTVRVWRISDASGKVTFTEEASGKVFMSVLDTNDVFLVHANIGIWLWHGQRSTQNEKNRSMLIADQYIAQQKLPNTMTVTVLSEVAAQTNSLFQSLFSF